jgi:transcriptional regulator with XRE-family HTH domain
MPRLQDLARARLVQWMDADPKKTQTEIGRAIGHNQAWVSKYRLGAMDADIDDLEGLARVFGHTLSELLDLRPDPQEQRLLDAFRALPERKRSLAAATLESMLPDPPKKTRRSSGKLS